VKSYLTMRLSANESIHYQCSTLSDLRLRKLSPPKELLRRRHNSYLCDQISHATVLSCWVQEITYQHGVNCSHSRKKCLLRLCWATIAVKGLTNIMSLSLTMLHDKLPFFCRPGLIRESEQTLKCPFDVFDCILNNLILSSIIMYILFIY